MRKPVVQAKPKLGKHVIPAGAKIVSTTMVNKDLDNTSSASPDVSATTTKPTATTITPLHSKPFISTADDINGFRQYKKKNKQNKQNKQLQNQGPPPIDLYEDYDPQQPTDYEQYKEEMEIIKQSKRHHHHHQRRSSYSSDEYARSRSRSRSPSPRRSSRTYAPPPELYENSRSHNRRHDHSSSSSSRHRSPSMSPPYRRKSRSPSPPPSFKRMDLQETGDDAYNRRLMLSQQQQKPMDINNTRSSENVAWKMMNKYGWQEGQGLGRSEDGIREALQVQARGDGSGVILPQKKPSPPILSSHNNNKNSSKVIVLKNMVGVGEVDDTLQQETADECAKYGTVEQCLIYEIPGGQVSNEEAVRIFVKFSNIQSASRAIEDLNGRYFDGRVVSAEFYDQARFDKLDLTM
ncbi:unnamed protein product [Cunninghamella echinulata]